MARTSRIQRTVPGSIQTSSGMLCNNDKKSSARVTVLLSMIAASFDVAIGTGKLVVAVGGGGSGDADASNIFYRRVFRVYPEMKSI